MLHYIENYIEGMIIVDLGKNELIEKLEKIQKRYLDTEQFRLAMALYRPEDSYKREIAVPQFPGESDEKIRKEWRQCWDHQSKDAIEIAKDAFRVTYEPPKPSDPRLKEYRGPVEGEEGSFAPWGCSIAFAVFLGAIALIALFMSDNDLTTTACYVVLAISVLPLVILTLIKLVKKAIYAGSVKKCKKEYNQYVMEEKAKHEVVLKNYEAKLAAYEEKRDAFLAEYIAWREIYIASQEEEDRIAEQLEADKQAGVQKIREEKLAPAEAALHEVNDLVPEKYLSVLEDLIDLLNSGRADDLKEAINLYEEIAYRERQLELQREAEEQRQLEEALRQEEESRRHKEEMKFLKDQEWQRRQDEERHRRAEDRRLQEEKENQRRAEQQAADRAKREAENRCRHCANYRTCTLRLSKPQNCSGFRPG